MINENIILVETSSNLFNAACDFNAKTHSSKTIIDELKYSRTLIY
jgi:hypothetical protein